MNNLFFTALSFGLLTFLRERGKGEVSLKNFSHLLKKGTEIFAAAAFLSILGYALLGRLPWPPVRGGEFLLPLVLPLGYLICRMQKSPPSFYCTVTAFAFFTLEKAGSLWDCAHFPALLAGLLTLFQILLEGLKGRLALAPAPNRVKGIPFLFFLAALAALVLHSIVLYF